MQEKHSENYCVLQWQGQKDLNNKGKEHLVNIRIYQVLDSKFSHVNIAQDILRNILWLREEIAVLNMNPIYIYYSFWPQKK